MKEITTTKFIMGLLIINFIILQVFTGWVTLIMLNVSAATGIIDFTPLVALITTVVGEVTTFLIYTIKSSKENTKGGLVYESTMAQLKEDLSSEISELTTAG